MRELGALLFDPETFNDQNDELTFNNYRLDEQQLLEYAKLASNLRCQIDANAHALNQADAVIEESKEDESDDILRCKLKNVKSTDDIDIGRDFNPSHSTRKRRTLRQLDVKTRLKVAALAASRTRTYKEIGIIYNIKVQVVKDLMKDAKKR